jgi:transposase
MFRKVFESLYGRKNMARYKKYSHEQGMLIPVSFHEQIVPGSFEFALHHIIENEMDLSVFDGRYHNDETGTPAFDPGIMLKIILYAYSLGITSSRQIEALCRSNIVFMALSADSRPHFTTIADFERKRQKIEASVAFLIKKHQAQDKQDPESCSMIEKFDSEQGRHYYSRRMGTVDPVFANIRNNLGLDRFSHRGKDKVDAQWKLFCIVHNMKKLFRYAPAYA